MFKIIVPLLFLLLNGCATQLPTFAHVHVGHALSGWPDTPNQRGLFTTSEALAVDIIEMAIAASELSKQGEHGAAVQAGSKIVAMIGTDADEFDDPENYTFLTAFTNTVNHLRYSVESPDATANLSQGLAAIVTRSDAVVTRTNVIKELAAALSTLEDPENIADAVQQLRAMAVQNLEGGDDAYSLKLMRNELAAMLDREDPPYTAPEQKYLFGVVRLPNGSWFWNFKSADDKGSYGRYSY